MRTKIYIVTLLLIFIADQAFSQENYAIVIHGGAGVMSKSAMSEEHQEAYKLKLNEALKLGQKLLKEGNSATDVVVSVIEVLENSPLFNAGKGAVFTSEGKNELDASIMEG